MAKKAKQRAGTILSNNFAMLKRIARYTPEYLILMLVEGAVLGAVSSAAAVFHYNLLNTVEAGGDFPRAVRIVALMAVFYLLAYGFDRWYTALCNPIMRQKLHLRMHEELFIKSHSLDLSCFDDPAFYNDFVWAMNETDTRAVEVVEDTGTLIKLLVSSGTLLAVLFTVDPVVALILTLTSAVTVVCNLIGNKVNFRHTKEANPLTRKSDYINRVYHLSDYAKEMRINRAHELLMEQYDRNTEELIRLDKAYGRKYFLLYGLGWNAIGDLTFTAIVLYMMTLLGKGTLRVGGFAASVGMLWSVRWMLTDLVETLTKYPRHSLYIEKYLEFMRFEPRVRGERRDIPPFESLELRNVGFSYEFSDHPTYRFHEEEDRLPVAESEGREALRDVSLKICRGDKVAFVGYNGAGKTTLIKLIMRLYDPTEGCILYNGIDIREFDPEAWRGHIGAVFQDFKIFAASIAENVVGREYREEERETVLRALHTADFDAKLAELDEGIDTHLTREFNEKGTNLSGGEAQKIAISRVFARQYPILILDEPSAALDPMAEYHLNQSILHHTEENTVIFISHRLSTTRIADRIYMFDSGRLIEEGSHTELLGMNGRYAEMFRVQAEKYREETSSDGLTC